MARKSAKSAKPKKTKTTKAVKKVSKKRTPRAPAPAKVETSNNPDEYIADMRQQQGYMPIGEHLEELRWRIIRSVIWIVIIAMISLIFSDWLTRFVLEPIVEHKNRADEMNIKLELVFTRLTEPFITKFKIALITGFILALPAVLFEFWGFIVPAIDKTFRRVGNGLLIGAIV